MISSFEWFVGMRYTRSGRGAQRRNGFISFIAALSVAGIALGVAALIIVLSVMNGFQKDVRDKMLSVLSHIEVRDTAASPGAPTEDWRTLAATVRADPRVVGAAPFVSGQVVVSRDDTVRGALLRGIDPMAEPEVSDIARQMRRASLADLEPGGFGVVIGRVMADQFGLATGDKLTLIAPQGTVTPAGVVPRLKQFTVRGTFESGHYEYDSSLILANRQDAARFFRSAATAGLRLRTADIQAAPQVARDLAARLGARYEVRDWSQENRVWFAAVQIEKRMMFIIMMLVIAVAAFNLVSMLVMSVTDKRADIAILRTIGASPRSILSIFMIQGAAVGLLGTLIGVLLGVAVGANVGAIVGFAEQLFGFRVLPPGIYVVSTLPSDLRPPDVGWIAFFACVLALAATIYPSLRAARVRPAEALRYE
ncbi:MAG: lipoprotein-releasing ABC transporter permease subunit [Lautropia sp.]